MIYFLFKFRNAFSILESNGQLYFILVFFRFDSIFYLSINHLEYDENIANYSLK